MFIIERLSILSQNGFILLVFLVTCLNFGLLIFPKIKKHPKKATHIAYFSSVFVIGYIVFSYYYYLIGMFGLYQEPFLTTFPLIVGILASIFTARRARYVGKVLISRKNGLLAFLIIFITLSILKAFPDIGFDSNWYHLSQPLYYLKFGRIFHIGGYIFPSGYPQFTEMLSIPLLQWGSSITTSLFSLFNYLLLGLSTFGLVNFFTKDTKYSLLSAVAVLTAPVIYGYSSFAYVDIVQSLCLLLSFYWISIYVEIRDKKNVLMAALMLIPVATIKYSGGLLCIALVGYLLFLEFDLKEKIKIVFTLALFPILGLVPWLIRNKIEVGNFLDPVGKVRLFHYGSEEPTYFDYFKNINWGDTLKTLKTDLPYDFLLQFVVVVLLILSVKNKRWSYLVFTILSLIIYRSMPPGNHFRFFIPFMPILIVFFISLLPTINNIYLKLGINCLLLSFVFFQIINILVEERATLKYAVGLKSVEDFKREFFVKEPFMFYDPSSRVKDEVGKQKLIVKGVDLIFPTLEEFNAKDYSFADLDRQEIYSFRTLRNEMLRNNYRYILVNRGNLQDHFSIWFEENDEDKVDYNFDLILQDGGGNESGWFCIRLNRDFR